MERQEDQLSVKRIERPVQSGRKFPKARPEIAYLAPQVRASQERDFGARFQWGHDRLELLRDDGSPMGVAQQLHEAFAGNMDLQDRVTRREPYPVLERPRHIRQPGYV